MSRNTINNRFRDLMDAKNFLFREELVSKLSAYLPNLSTRELELLAGCSNFGLPRPLVNSPYRSVLIRKVIEGLDVFEDCRLEAICKKIPFRVYTEPTSKSCGQPTAKRHRTRRTRKPKLTTKQLDRELEQYFRRDPVRYAAILDLELEEYFRTGPLAE